MCYSTSRLLYPIFAKVRKGNVMSNLTQSPGVSQVFDIWLRTALETAVSIDLFKHIGSGCTVADLAEKTAIDKDGIVCLIDILTDAGIVQCQGGMIRNTEQSLALRSDSQSHLYAVMRFVSWPEVRSALNHLPEVLRAGTSYSELAGEPDIYELLETNPEMSRVFEDSIYKLADQSNEAIAQAYPFAGKVLDVGGGMGALLATICRTHHVEGYLFDQPQVIQSIEYDTPFTKLAGNFLKAIEIPLDQRIDIAVARDIYHCLSNEKCALLSENLRKVMHDGSKLVVCEQLLETSVVARKPDLLMRSSYGGRKRSQQGWIYLLTQHGFLFAEAIHTNPSTLLVFNV